MSAYPEDIPRIGTSDFQPTLTIEFPKAKERYKITSASRTTDIALQPRMRLKVVAYGYVAKGMLDFGEDENRREWTVVLDEVELIEE